MRLISFLLLAGVLLAACAENSRGRIAPRAGSWRIELGLADGGLALPFTFDLTNSGDSVWTMVVHNADETIEVHDIELRADSITIRMPLFDSEFVGVMRGDSVINGFWHNHLKGPGYKIPFSAVSGRSARFPRSAEARFDASGSWRTLFSQGTSDAYNAIGQFQQGDSGAVVGTFLTETGDYRFLEGAVRGDSLLLSSFDGSHAFLFRAVQRNDSLFGRFYSGTHWQEPWVAVRDATYRLRDPDSLTTLREGHDMVDFRFEDTNGDLVSSSDVAFRGKPLMVQIMGSWCPNCVDEAKLLRDVYGKYHEHGLEVVAIAFEKHEDPELAFAALRHFKKELDIPYPVLYGGSASKEEASSKLPFLDRLMSYPTCIFIGRNGVVRRIRTGFYGPGTGEHYEHYTRNLDVFIEGLLAEGPADTSLD